jgi:hypothetical protein
MAGSVCLVTIHGIGFQRAAKDGAGVAGYADQLHDHLHEVLGDDLGDDPRRSSGPVYVSSEWNGSPADGLARLDPDAALAKPGKIAHVALVYSPSESLKPHPAETAGALARAAASHHRYASAPGILRLLLCDAWAALHENDQGGATSNLVPRGDLRHQGVLGHLLHKVRRPLPGRSGSSRRSRTTSRPISHATSCASGYEGSFSTHCSPSWAAARMSAQSCSTPTARAPSCAGTSCVACRSQPGWARQTLLHRGCRTS